MFFLWLGILALLLKLLDVSPVASLAWWVVLSPFGWAVVWWAWADWSGYTRKKVMQKEDRRKQKRIDKQRQAMGQRKRPK